MATAFNVKVVTPDGEVWSGEATSVVVPGLDGDFGVWAGHMPLIAGMGTGRLMIKTPSEHVITLLAVSGGFVEVGRDGVTVLAESAELAEDIDLNRVTESERRARERLSRHFDDVDVERAQVALQKSLNRKRVAEFAKSKPTNMM